MPKKSVCLCCQQFVSPQKLSTIYVFLSIYYCTRKSMYLLVKVVRQACEFLKPAFSVMLCKILCVLSVQNDNKKNSIYIKKKLLVFIFKHPFVSLPIKFYFCPLINIYICKHAKFTFFLSVILFNKFIFLFFCFLLVPCNGDILIRK